LYKVPCQLVQERGEAEDSREYALPESVTPPFKKQNEMIMVSTVDNATMQDKLDRYVEKIKISSCITECNRNMIGVTEQPIISCITPFSEKQ
jgi:hypothetical protein